jgi:predicted permease
MNTWLWRRVRRRLDRVVPPARSAAVIGDLQEDYARRRASVGRLRANLWLGREARSLVRAYRAASAPGGPQPVRVLAGIASDVRVAIRRLRASPTFTIFAVLTLALGIGATTAIYSVIRAALTPPTGVTTLDRLVTITHSDGGSVPMIALSPADFHDLRARQTQFRDVAGWTYLRVSISASGETGSAWAERVTGEYFQVLGVKPALGRTLQPADDDPAAPPVTVLSYGLWQRMFGGRADALGKLIKVNGLTCEVVGVAPQEFAGLFNNGLVPSAVWLPLASSRSIPGARNESDLADRSNRWLLVRARLKDGATLDTARADVSRIAQQLDQEHPLGSDENPRVRSRHNTSRPWIVRRTADTVLNEGADRFVRPVAATVMAAVGLVLLVACTNLANLMLARGSGRREETAIRLALGASRGRLLRGELVESLLLAGVGGLAGLGIAQVVLVFLGNDVAVGNNTSIRFVPKLDATVLALSAAATVLSVLVAGVLPAMQSTRPDLRASIASGGSSAALPRWRGRRLLITGQVMVSVILLAVAGLCLGQLRERSRIDVGMDLDRLALVEVDFVSQQIAEPQVRAIASSVLSSLARRPGVTRAAISSGLPVGIGAPSGYAGERLNHRADLVAGTPGLFETLGVRIVKGRALTERDTSGAEPVAVVSEFTAKALFDTTDVVGRSFSLKRSHWVGEPEQPTLTRTIVGVASDTETGEAFSGRGGVVYLPFSQHYEGRLVFSARTDGDPADLVPMIRQALSAAEPTLAVAQATTGAALRSQENVFLQVSAGLTGILGGFALALALAGLYGALSHVVLRRRREIGLRIALGASGQQILHMVLRDGLRPVIAGIVLGLGLGMIARQWMASLILRLLPAPDPFILVLVPALLLACGVAACLIPARRASRVDPNLALRDL